MAPSIWLWCCFVLSNLILINTQSSGDVFGQCGLSTHTPYFEQKCASLFGFIEGRWCFSSSNRSEPMGLDISNCSFTSFPSEIPRDKLLFLYMPGNHIGTNGSEFCGFVELNEVMLDAVTDCPGGLHSWSTQQSLYGFTHCSSQLEFCATTLSVFKCPEHSHCAFFGPGCFRCLCDKDYYGYKCLKKTGFPAVAYAVGLSVATVVTGLLLWFHRRFHFSSMLRMQELSTPTDPIH